MRTGRQCREARASPLRAVAAVVAAGVAAGCSSPPPPAWTDAGTHRWRPLVVDGDRSGFTALRPSRTGIEFANRLSPSSAQEHDHLLIGSGVAVGDVDGDERPDLYLARLEGPNALYHNRGGWRFEDVTDAAGVAAADRYSTGAVFADVDGDGDLDLWVTALGGPATLFVNDGAGRFTDGTAAAGLESSLGTTTSTFADVDGDGDLDLYVAAYKVESASDVLLPYERPELTLMSGEGADLRVSDEAAGHFRIETKDGRPVAVEQADPDRLYLNDGSGRFQAVPWTEGRFLDEDGRPLERDLDDFGLAARFHDVDGDGDPDLYVCNDFDDPDQLWINDGAGVFRAVDRLALRTSSNASMSVDFADVDRDGDVDIFVADMLSRDSRRRLVQMPLHRRSPSVPGVVDDRPQFQRNTLFVNRGDGTFAQLAEAAGVDASEWTWGSLFLDVDLDAYPDLLVANGHGRDTQDGDALARIRELRGRATWAEAKTLYPELRTANDAFRNRGDLTFEPVGEAWGFGVEADISHGLAAGDLDGDGDLDVVVNRLGDPALVLRNDAAASRIAVRLRGLAPNTSGVGARVALEGGSLPRQSAEMTSGGLYLSGSEALLSFAARSGESLTLEVRWPRGGVTRVVDVAAGRLYEIPEPDTSVAGAEAGGPVAEAVGGPLGGDAAGATGVSQDEPARRARSTGGALFEDASALLDHAHVESAFDDFGRQPLLPYRLSRLGPGASWLDVDGDGDPDLVVPPAAGGTPDYLSNEGGRFRRVAVADGAAAFDLTQTVIVPSPSGRTLIMGQASFEARTPDEARGAAPALAWSAGRRGEGRPVGSPGPSSTGPLAAADVNGDGALDVFVGGRTVPALYPLPASSRLLLATGDGFREDPDAARVLDAVGMVTAATFTDLDDDADPDLVLAREWASPVVLVNDDGRLRDASSAWGVDGLAGSWLGVAAGDLNGDGRMDLVLTSWGRNVRERPRAGRPLRLHHGDFDQNGVWDLLLAQDDGGGVPRPLGRFERLRAAVPALGVRFRDFAAFANADLPTILGGARAARLEATTFDHTLLLNRGGSFEATPLPSRAQWAPSLGVSVVDVNGDGAEDVVMAQNFFPTHPEAARLDAGRGLVLLGDGGGGLSPLDGVLSGVIAYGDQRAVAAADFDGDARIDLVLTQNGGPTRLFHNVAARPGLRVRLTDGPNNPHAVGARVRVVYGDRSGPSREVRMGGGPAAVDGPVQVLGLDGQPTHVEVRWPGGAVTRVPVPPGAREVVASSGGGSR